MSIQYFVDTFTLYKNTLNISGWLFSAGDAVRAIQVVSPLNSRVLDLTVGLPSQDVEAHHGQAAKNSRFDYEGSSPFQESEAGRLYLNVIFDSGDIVQKHEFLRACLLREPVHRIFDTFLNEMAKRDGGTLIEIGARARSGVSRKALVPPRFKYVGVDILQGDNVDLLADAHQLSNYFLPESIDGIFCFSLFEHLLMPWKVAIEMNKVMKTGALGAIVTHQSWPVHDAPCDYWRFSAYAWKGLFNRDTGFEVLSAQQSDPAYLVPNIAFPDRSISYAPNCYLQSGVLIRKIAATRLEWDVASDILETDHYPT